MLPFAKPVAELVLALCTLGGFAVAAWQLRQNRKLANQNFARQTWLEYIKLGLDNPDLGETRIALRSCKVRTPRELVAGNTVATQRYLWFLALTLEACENLLLYFPTDQWRQTIDQNLGYHVDALRELWPGEAPFYSPLLNRAVERVISVHQ